MSTSSRCDAPDIEVASINTSHEMSIGRRPLLQEVAQPGITDRSERPGGGLLLRHLTRRELDIVRLVGGGLPNRVIARQLGLAEGTVKVHLHNIYQKLGIPNRASLAALAATPHP